MNSTTSDEISASTSLHKLWRTRYNLEMNDKSEETLRDEAAKLQSLVILHADNGVIVGVIPIRWGETVLGHTFLNEMMRKYHLMHITDSAGIYKYLRAWNRA